MGKGTPSSAGGKIVHFRCRRCGKHSFHRQKRVCSSCGFGRTTTMRHYDWAKRH